MRLIGLCGRSGSGKTVFSDSASKLGFIVVDCDKVYSSLVDKRTKCLDELEKRFGSEVIKDNSLNRAKMAEIVFSDEKKLALLNKITHKHVIKEVEKIIKSSPEESIILLDAPTLFESGLDKRCDLVVAVLSDDENCVKRIVERDGITKEKALSRLNSQKSAEFLIENCDVIVYNDSTLEVFEKSCLDVCEKIKEGSL